MTDAEALEYATKARRAATRAAAVEFWDWAIKKATVARKPTQPVGAKPKRDRAAYMRDVYRPKLAARLARLRELEDSGDALR